MAEAKVGIIGGTGLYELEGLIGTREVRVKTPFGDPSDAIILGTLNGVKLAFLPRHGRGHYISPTGLPSRANIYALKSLGVEWIISVATVGSLKERIEPLDIVIPDQIIDRTCLRPNTFFDNGIVGHIAFAEPFCPVLRDILYSSAIKVGARAHDGGTAIVMEGPQFSTKAESNLYRSWGADVIYMTGLPEAKLAREAEICYATCAIVTDYDCWKETAGVVTAEMVVANLRKGVDTVKKIITEALTHLPQKRDCPCASALKDALVTSPELIPPRVRKDLALLLDKYLKKGG